MPAADPKTRRRRDPEGSKRQLLELFAQGVSVEVACRQVGKSPKTHEYYLKTDEEYKLAVARLRAGRAQRDQGFAVPEFADFRREYLGRDTFWHQHQWIDLLEGETPRDLHPSEIFQPADPDWLIFNTPPEHSKSTTITVDYVVWRICQDPNIRVILVSKTATAAKKWLYQIKTILTHQRYLKLQMAFGPVGGFQVGADQWAADQIYLGQATRDSGEKDPTVQVIGMGQQIYGSRADLIILDDCIVLSNAHEFEKQIEWIQQEVLTRPSSNGRILVVGTRVAPQDLYSELRNGSRYADGESPWTYFAQPAVLEFADDPHDWVTLWPECEQVCACRTICKKSKDPNGEGRFPKWDGPHLFRRRGVVQPSTWQRVYMQQDVADDQVFRPECVAAATNGMRTIGPLVPLAPGHPEHGGEGHYVIGSMDPAMAGCTAAIIYSVDRATSKRYVLEVHNQPGMTPLAIRGLIKFWTEKYRLNEWRIEGNAFQNYLAQDQELKDWLASRGCVLNPHITGRNKWDPDFGVASMAPLFGDVDAGKVTRDPLIELPSSKQVEAVRELRDQLITWMPEQTRNRSVKTDIVMALWFAEIRAREILNDRTYGGTHVPNKYVTGYQKRQQYAINLDDAWSAKQLGMVQGDYLPVAPVAPRLPTPWRAPA